MMIAPVCAVHECLWPGSHYFIYHGVVMALVCHGHHVMGERAKWEGWTLKTAMNHPPMLLPPGALQ